MDLSPFGRGGSPDGLAIPFRLQLAELSQLAQSSCGLLAQPTCAHVARDMLNQVALELRCARPWCWATGLSTSTAIPTRPVRDVVDPATGRHRRE